MILPDRDYTFPVAEVGLGQMGVLRGRRHAYDHFGAALQKASRLLREGLDPSAKAGAGPSARKRSTSHPLRRKAPCGKLKTE